MKQSNLVLMAMLTAALFLSPIHIHSQSPASGALPPWVDDSRRAAAYPAESWYVGYAVASIGRDKPEDVRKRVENEARNELAKGISVHIQSESQGTTTSQQTRTGGDVSETIRKNYGQIIQAVTNLKIEGVAVISHLDQASGRIHALASANKAELAKYYAGRIDFYLQVADNDIKLAKQHNEADRKRSALEKLEEAKNNIAESKKHYDMLRLVDRRGDVKRLLDKTAQLESELAATENALRETAAVFVTGKEIIGHSEVDIVVPGLQNLFSQNGCRVTTKREEAGFILTIDVRDHMTSSDKNFSYCYASVRADLTNVKTGKTDAKLNFTAPKASWTNMERACQNAMNEAIKALWKEISTKTEVCR